MRQRVGVTRHQMKAMWTDAFVGGIFGQQTNKKIIINMLPF